jgi:hypothetical protein
MLIYLPIRTVALPVLLGLGHMTTAATAHMLATLASIALSYLTLRMLGLDAVIVSNGLTYLGLGILLGVAAARAAKIAPATFFRETTLKAAVGMAVVITGGLLLKTLTGPLGYAGIVGVGLAVVTLFAVVWSQFVLANDEHVDLSAVTSMTRRLRRSTAG